MAARDALPVAVRAAASAAIAARIVALPSFAAARTMLVTLPFRSEWDTRLVVDRALAAGKTVVSPRVDPVARMLSLHRIADPVRDVGARLSPAFPSRLEHCAVVAGAEVDWVLVPGVAFDIAGRRLGYGGGYYDRLLPLLPADAPRIAGAFDLQIVAAVPFGPHDITVDAIVTETRVVDLGIAKRADPMSVAGASSTKVIQ